MQKTDLPSHRDQYHVKRMFVWCHVCTYNVVLSQSDSAPYWAFGNVWGILDPHSSGGVDVSIGTVLRG